MHMPNKSLVNVGTYKNRPMVNLNRPEFDLHVRNYHAYSPTQRKSSLVTGSVLKNYKSKKPTNFMKETHLLQSKYNDIHSAETFMRGK